MIRKIIRQLIQLKSQNLFEEIKNINKKYVLYMIELFKKSISDKDIKIDQNDKNIDEDVYVMK